MTTFKLGNGWVTFDRGRVTATGLTAIECKARATIQRSLTPAAVAKLKHPLLAEVAKQKAVQL